MKNKDVAKTVIATGAAVVVITSGAPFLIMASACLGIGTYLGVILNRDDKKKDDENGDKEK